MPSVPVVLRAAGAIRLGDDTFTVHINIYGVIMHTRHPYIDIFGLLVPRLFGCPEYPAVRPIKPGIYIKLKPKFYIIFINVERFLDFTTRA